MKNHTARGVFVIGTGTDVGKTYDTALLIKHLRSTGLKAHYYKAAASGNPRINGYLEAADARFVKEMAHIDDQKLENMVPYVYEAAVSPHLAARETNHFLSLSTVLQDYQAIADKSDFVVVEGCGGILCPLVYEKQVKIWQEDLIRALQVPLLLVADAGLGTLNATGLTLAYLKQAQLPLHGLILNRFDATNPMHIDNRTLLQEMCPCPILACVPVGSSAWRSEFGF